MEQRIVYPACAGIHLKAILALGATARLPRMRGDPPSRSGINAMRRLSTPHARGSTAHKDRFLVYGHVYPACAGIHPLESGNI